MSAFLAPCFARSRTNRCLGAAMDALAAREAQNADLDQRAEATAQQAEALLRQHALRLETAELVPPPVDGVVLEDSGEALPPDDPPPEPAGAEAATSCGARGAARGLGAPPAVEGAEAELGDVTRLRLQSARLMVLEEESVKLRSLLEGKTAALNAAEREVKEEQQQRAKLERSEKMVHAQAKGRNRAPAIGEEGDALERLRRRKKTKAQLTRPAPPSVPS